MEQQHLALLFDTFTDRVGDRKPVFKYEQGLVNTEDLHMYGRDSSVSAKVSAGEVGEVIK